MSPSTMTTHRASAVGSPGEPPAGSDLRSGVPSTPAAAGRARRRWAIALACVSALVAVRPSHAAGTYYVDASSPSCSKSGPGTATQPYCSITSATNAHKGAGITIIVRPGVYPEQVTVPASGSSASPFVLQAQGGTVVVDGADDFGAAAQWVLYSGDVWLAASVNWSPLQVFADGARLAASGASPASLPAGTFRWVSKQGLYVNVGGGNPGDHQARVGHRTYGFVLSGRSYVTLDGFTVTRTEDRTIYLSSCSNCTITHNTVNFANKYGIEVKGGSGTLIGSNTVSDNNDHGIGLTSGATGITVENNESFRNARPSTRAANGIYLFGSPANVLRRNRLHDNQDTGLHLQASSNNCIEYLNRSWNNGDHGYDHLLSTGTIHICDVAYGNYKDGFSIEGGDTGTQLYDCIAIDNGLTTNEYDLWVDQQSSAGFVSNYNIFWNSTSQPPVKYISTRYSSVAAYSAASGQDAQTLQLNPLFVNPAAGDFHLRAGSPAIDDGTSAPANWPATDADGRARADDPQTANNGAGPVPYSDRGAFEYQPPAPPVARLTVSPSSGTAPLPVTADASASTDADGTIVSYRFDFGDGTVVGPQPGATATHTYGAGVWTPTVTATDNDGGSSSASATVNSASNQPPNGVIDLPLQNVTIYAGQSVSFAATGTDPDNTLPLSYVWDFGGAAANQAAEDPGPVVFSAAGTYSVTLTVTDAFGLADPTPASVVVTVTPPPAGVPSDEVHWTFTGQTSVTFDWRGSDPTLRYGASASYGQSATGVTPAPIPFSSPGPYWETPVSGLQENTTYHYSIGGGPDHTFKTPPPRGSSEFTVLVEGDIGASISYPRVAAVQSDIATAGPDFALLIGDLTYGSEHGQAAVDRHFDDVMIWSQDAAYMPAWGNHEWETPEADDLRNYKGRFGLPNPQASPGAPAAGGAGEDWYWFDYGNVRFIGYPEPYSGAWSDWNTRATALMDAAQSDPAISFIVTFGHRPAYSSGHHSGDPLLKSILDGLGATHSKYVLNLNGHSHDYERSYPQSGVTHITAGTGGSDLEEAAGSCLWSGGCPPPAWSAYRALHHGALRLRFSATGIKGVMICGPAGDNGANKNDVTCTEGGILDSFTLGSFADEAPVTTAPSSVAVAENQPVSVGVTAVDPDGDPITALTADLSGLPAGNNATFTPGSGNTAGTLTWTPTFSDGGSYTVRFTAANALSGTAATVITVTNVDRAPAVTAPAAALGVESSPLTVSIRAADPDGEAITSLTADLSNLPARNNAVFTPGPGDTTGTLTWTPTNHNAGSYTVRFTAGNALSGSATTAITVSNLDRAPVVTAPAAVSGAASSAITVAVTASDPDGQAITSLTANLSGLPAGNNASFTPGPGDTSGTLTWTPAAADTGSFGVTFTASNSLSGSASTTITVTFAEHPPAVTAPASASLAEASPLTVGVQAADPDGQAITSLTADLSGLPAGNNAVFTPGPGNTSGALTWTPTYNDAGSYTVRFTAANALSGSAATVITVSNVDRAPVVSAPASVIGSVGSLMTVAVKASDPDGQAITSLTADLSGLPAGNNASFTPGPGDTTGTFTWTPASGQAGSYTVGFAAANALAGSSATAISVTTPNQPPVATLTASPSTGNEPLSVTLDASGSGDPDGAIASYRFDCGDGTVIGPQPGATTTHVFASGNWLSSVTVTDNNGAVASASQAITVAAVGSGPNLVGNPSFEVNTNGWGVNGGSTIQRAAGGFDGGYSLSMTGPASTAIFGVNDSPNWIGNVPAAGTRYRLNGWVRSASAGGSSRLHLREYLNGVRVGASGYFSNSARLSPSWTLLYEDYVAQSTGSTLDLQVEDVPLAFTEVFQVDNLSIRIVSSTPSAPALASQDPEAGSRVQAWSTAIGPVLDLGASDPLWKVRFGATSSAPADQAARFTRFALVYRGREVAACQATPVQESADPEAPDLARMAGHAGPEASGAALEILEVTFDRGELRKLFAGLAAGGRQSLTVEIVGERAGAPSEVAALAVQVSGAPVPLEAAVSPSPMRSEGLLEFATSRAGLLEVQILDLAGRRVRQLSNQADAPAGWHRLAIDGRGDGGSQLKAGVYFYRIRAGEGTVTGRFVILR